MSILKNRKINSIVIIASFLTAALLPMKVLGYPHGSLIPDGGTYTFEAQMNNQLLVNEKNAETVFKFDVGNWPYFDIYCQTYMNPGGPSSTDPDSGVTYNLVSTIPMSMENSGYLTLNEYFDVKVEIEIGGNIGGERVVPQSNLWNGGSASMECRPPSVNSRMYAVPLRTGSKGTVTFRLKKPIINGITINQAELVQVFAKKGSPANGSTGYAPIPSTRVVLAAGIITVADECIINDGSPINIRFGDVGNTSEQLNGSNYTQPFAIPVKCRGGSFTTGDLNIKLSLLPGASGSADFNSDYFGTLKNGIKRTNLGIKITDNVMGTIVRPNQAYQVPNFVNNQGVWNLSAAPIAAPESTVDDGEFTATGTILAEFQ